MQKNIIKQDGGLFTFFLQTNSGAKSVENYIKDLKESC